MYAGRGVICMKSCEKFHPLKIETMSHNVQGFVFYLCRNYNRLGDDKRAVLDEHFEAVGGTHAQALKRLMTTQDSMQSVCLRYHIGSMTTLVRLRREFYRSFPINRMIR